uniref:Uncharacterized protein n=1 Tax=Anguilla anguilla TaxID=7936 RepID=A0A0E9U5L3_ANGAN
MYLRKLSYACVPLPSLLMSN